MFYKQNLFQADTHLRRIKTKHSFLSERICRKKFEVLLYEVWKEGSAILILIVRALVVMFCCCLGKKLSTLISCEQALHLGDKVKTGRARGTREETRKRGVGLGGGLGCPRAARFVCPNRRACSQASTLRTLLPLASGSSHDPPPPPPHPFPSNVVRKDNLLAPFLLEIQQGEDVGVASFSYTTIPR